MCGRFTLHSQKRIELKGLVNLDLPYEPRYNIAPTQDVVTISNFGYGIRSRLLKWGLIPSWSTDGKGFINARSETLCGKPSFRESFRLRRCLIPADAFYEWRRKGREKQPFCIQSGDGRLLMFAGIWDTWHGRNADIASCAIVTTAPNELVAKLHDRMPAILSEEACELWLDKKAEERELLKILTPFAASAMSMHPVSQKVNSTDNDCSDLIEPVDIVKGETMSLF